MSPSKGTKVAYNHQAVNLAPALEDLQIGCLTVGMTDGQGFLSQTLEGRSVGLRTAAVRSPFPWEASRSCGR